MKTRLSDIDNGKFQPRLLSAPKKLLNKSFYRFLFSFIAVVAGVLLFVLVLGASGGVQ